MAAQQFQRVPLVIQPSPITLLYAEDLVTAKPYRDANGVEGAPRFGAQVLIPGNHPQIGALGQLLKDMAAQYFPGGQCKFPTASGDALIAKANARAVAEGKKAPDKSYYAGKYVLYVKSNEKSREGKLLIPPRLVALQNGKMVDYLDGQRPLAAPFFYSGVQACVAVNFQAYSGFGGGITCYIERAMSFGSGDRIQVGRSNEDVFGSADSYSEYVGHVSAEAVVVPFPGAARPDAPGGIGIPITAPVSSSPW